MAHEKPKFRSFIRITVALAAILGAIIAADVLSGGLSKNFQAYKDRLQEEFEEIISQAGGLVEAEEEAKDELERPDSELIYGPDAWEDFSEMMGNKENTDALMVAELELNERYERVHKYDDTRYLLYTERDFDKVEEQLDENFATKSEPWKAHRYSGLISTMGTYYAGEDTEVFLSTLNQWVEAKPESHYARLVRGNFYNAYAWKFRGGGYANTVTGDGWQRFERYLNLAKRDLDQAHAMNPNDPEASNKMIDTANGLGMSDADIRGYYERAIEINPLHYEARFQYMHVSRPIWGGSIRKVFKIARSAEKHFDEFPHLAWLLYSAHQFQYSAEELSEEEHNAQWRDEKYYEADVAQLAMNPGDVHLMKRVAFFAKRIGKIEISANHFDMIGDRFPTGTYTDFTTFHLHRADAYAQYARDLLGEGKHQEAEKYAKRALEFNPKSPMHNEVYASVLKASGQPPESDETILARKQNFSGTDKKSIWISLGVWEREKKIATQEQLKEAGHLDRYAFLEPRDDTRAKLYEDKDYDLVESRLDEHFATEEEPLRAYRYTRLLEKIGEFTYEDDPDDMLATVNAWVVQKPDSYRARLVRGILHSAFAWRIRGSKPESQVHETLRESYQNYLELAQQDLEAAYKLNPDDPEASYHMMRVAFCRDASGPEIRVYYAQALEANALHYGARSALMGFAKPEWMGSIDELMEIALEVETAAKKFPYLILISRGAREGIYRAGGISEQEWRELDVDSKCTEAYLAQLEMTPGDLYVIDAVTNSAYYAGNFDVAVKHFDLLGDRYPDGGSWGWFMNLSKNHLT